MQVFQSHPLYRYTGKDVPGGPPEGFDENPSLVDYLNHLAQEGLRVFTVVAYSDSMWYNIITVKESQ